MILNDQMPDTHVSKCSGCLIVLFRISEGSLSQLQSAQDENVYYYYYCHHHHHHHHYSHHHRHDQHQLTHNALP